MTLFNYKNMTLVGILVAFNAYCMINDKFNFAGLPLDMQKIIMHAAINDNQVTSLEFYKNLVNLIELSAPVFDKAIQTLKNDIDSGRNKKINQWILNQALIHAVKVEDAALAKALIALGADAKAWDPQTRRPIIDSIKNPKIKTFLLKHGAIENVSYTSNQQIIDAVCSKNIKLLKNLINSGANVEAKNKDKYTALMCAANLGYTEIVKELINSGANINEKEDTINYENVTALFCAINSGQIETAKELINSGPNINAIEDNDRNPLIVAVRKEYLEIIKELIKSNTNIQNNDKDTALIAAVMVSHLDIVKELIKIGANPNTKNRHQRTALDIAKIYQNTEIVNFLEQLNK